MKSLCKRILFLLFASVFFILGCSSDSKELSVNPSTFDFGDVNIGYYKETVLTLKNNYGSQLIIQAFDIGMSNFFLTAGFSVPVTMENGDVHKLTLRFEPLSAGKMETTLVIDHNGSEKDRLVSITGRGVACARIDFSEKSYDFLKRTIGKSHTHDVEITNIGTDELNITGLNFNGTGATAYKVTPAPLTIPAGTKQTITITFEPTALIQYDADLIIEHDAVNEEASFVFNVSGEGRDADPQITLTQSSPWDFGRVVIGKSIVKECEVENTGLDPLKISAVTLQTAAEFTIDSIKDSNGQIVSFPHDIAVGDKIVLAIKFEPSAKNTFSDTLSIDHSGTNESSPIDITLDGKGVTSGLDFNGDGFCDVIVGADYDDDGGTDAGCVFMFFGSSSPSTTIDAALADVKFVGEDAGDGFGSHISSIGDFNGDGYDDILINASFDADGGTDSGSAYIFFGNATPPSVIDASTANVKFIGVDPGDRFGVRVSEAGDFNNDGYDDIIVGAHLADDGGSDSGCAYIFFGSATPASKIDASTANVLLIGADSLDRFGVIVSTAGDFNNDGFDDVIVGADCDDDGGTDAGCAFIFFGSATPASTIDASAASVKLVGGDAGDKFGYNVTEKVDDFNMDGFDDVIVGSHADDDGGTDAGCAFVFYGSASPASVIDASAADIKFVGESSGDGFGIRVSTAGDFNKDGYIDIIVGAYLDDDGGTTSGCAFIFFGSASPASVIDASAANIKLVGASSNDRFGHYVSTAGDFNNDGFTDVIVGAYLDDDGGTDCGCAFIFLGSSTPATIIDASAANVRLVGADSKDRFSVALSG